MDIHRLFECGLDPGRPLERLNRFGLILVDVEQLIQTRDLEHLE